MAIKKHALTKEGAIIAITRNQLGEENKSFGKGINKTFVELYMNLSDEKIKETYKSEFGIELEIVKLK